MDEISKMLYELCGRLIEKDKNTAKSRVRKTLNELMDNSEYMGAVYTGLKLSGMSAEDLDKRMNVLTCIIAEALHGAEEDEEYKILDDD